MMEILKCQCCGAPINRATMTCEFCGTQYQRSQNDILRIETYSDPVVTLRSNRAITDEELKSLGPELASEIALRSICREFADSMMPFIKVDTNLSPGKPARVYGTVKFIRPKGEN